MKIDFVSDVSCPWCAIGLKSLETALERIGPDLPVELHFQPFELNPQMGPEGQDIAEHLNRSVIELCGLDRAAIVGLSVGGLIAQGLAAHPGRGRPRPRWRSTLEVAQLLPKVEDLVLPVTLRVEKREALRESRIVPPLREPARVR